MSVEHLAELGGLPVVDFDPEEGATKGLDKVCYRIGSDYDNEFPLADLLKKFVEDYDTKRVRSLVLGNWAHDIDTSSEEAVKVLAESKEKLPSLEYLFIGDVTRDEWEISWIRQCDLTQILEVFPGLAYFGIRGSDGLNLRPVRHIALRELVVECGGLPSKFIDGLSKSILPELERLTLYLGSENYGWGNDPQILKPLLDPCPFPKLKYLALRSSEQASAVAEVLADSSIFDQIEVLDLSQGALENKGARALIDSGKLPKLNKLNIYHHYVSDDIVTELNALDLELDARHSGLEDEEEYEGEIYRYIMVSE